MNNGYYNNGDFIPVFKNNHVYQLEKAQNEKSWQLTCKFF